MSVVKQRLADAPQRLAGLAKVLQDRVAAEDGYTVADQWEETADRRGDNMCFWSAHPEAPPTPAARTDEPPPPRAGTRATR